jgi:hypothetical protein
MSAGVFHTFIAPGIHRFTAKGAALSAVKLRGAQGVIEEWHLSGKGADSVNPTAAAVSEVCPGTMQSLDLEVLCAADYIVITSMPWRPVAVDWCADLRRRPCPDNTQGSLPCLFDPPFASYPEKGLCEFDELKRTRIRLSTSEREPIDISLPVMNLGTM